MKKNVIFTSLNKNTFLKLIKKLKTFYYWWKKRLINAADFPPIIKCLVLHSARASCVKKRAKK